MSYNDQVNCENWTDILADEDSVSDEAFDDFLSGEEMPDCF